MKKVFLIICTIICCCPMAMAQSAKSDSLFAIGVDLYNAGKYQEAIPVFEACDKLDKVELDSTSNRRDYSVMWLASCYYQLGNSVKAESIHSYFKFVPVDRRLTIISDSLSKVGEYYLAHNDLKNALEFWRQCAEIEKTVVGDKHIWYGNTINGCARLYHNLNDSTSALSYIKEWAEIIKYNYGEMSSQYAYALMNVGNVYTSFNFDNNLVNALNYWLQAYRIGKFEDNDIKSVEANIGAISFDIGDNYSKKQDFQKAIEYFNISLKFKEKYVGKESTDYAVGKIHLALNYAYMGDLDTAIKLMSEVLTTLEKTQSKDATYLICLNNLADFYTAANARSEVLRVRREVLELCEKLNGKESSEYIEALDKLANCYSSAGNYFEAEKLESEAVQISEVVYGKETPNYAILLSRLADFNSYLGNDSLASQIGKIVLHIFEITLGKNTSYYATALHCLAKYTSNLGNYNDALNMEKEASEIRAQTLGKEHVGYALSLDKQALYYSLLGNYANAIQISKQAIEIVKKGYGEQDPTYAQLLHNLAHYNALKGDFTQAINILKESLPLTEALHGKSSEYASSLHNLSLMYSAIGNYQEAIVIEKEALIIMEKIFGNEHPNYGTCLAGIAHLYSDLGNYDEAVNIEKKALEITKKHYGSEHPEYAGRLHKLAQYYSNMNNYPEAIKIEQKALSIWERALGKNSPEYSSSLHIIAICKSHLGNNDDAIRIEEEALLIAEKIYGKNHVNYGVYLSLLADCYNNIGKHEKAIELQKESLAIVEKSIGKKNSSYVASLQNLSSYYSSMKNYSDALKLMTESMTLSEKVLGHNHPEHAMGLSSMSVLNYKIGNYDEAIQLGEDALDIIERTLGEKHMNMSIILRNISGACFKAGKKVSLIKYARRTSEITSSIILNDFTSLTLQERNKYWEKYGSWFNCTLPVFSYIIADDSLCENSYNGLLLSKGLLMNSDIEFRKLLMESSNREVIDIYDNLQMNRLMLDRQYEKPITERTLDTDSLEKSIDKLEHKLIELSKVFGDYTKNLRIKWQDVRAKLGQKDVSIEFVSFPLTNDSTMYIAYVLKKDMTSPKMIPLFEEKQLKKEEGLYKNTSVSKLVWEPLAEYLEGVQNVYFAPAGELYNNGIEYLPHWSGEGIMSEKWNMYRLSSTRQLAVIKDKNALKQASIYGGVKYDTKEDLLVADSRKYRSQERSFNYEPFAIVDSLNLRAGASYLPATKTEAEEIDKTLGQKKIMTKLLIDTLATEGAFKDLSGKKTNLLHIATHGFYWTEKEAKYKDNLSFLMLNDNQPRYVEDKALTRSGLLLAGANNALMGKKLPEGVDDGILTAKEISQLDLRGLDLVVLSACETGLGEIKGDGVFGLQRGFKKAGANSLLMSLWKVDDNATQLLMTQFYKNLTSGMSKFESLQQAQKYLRDYEVEVEVKSDTRPAVSAHTREQAQQNANKEKTFKKVKKYEDPKYWAAFILLDAID